MNKVVRKHYPAARLPAELREGIPSGSLVEVTVAEEKPENVSMDALRAMLLDLPKRDVSLDEAVSRIRDLRNEWDD